ncbi:MAG: hypothetical protein M9942_13820 [Microthrixaceae bacterium]|nr:hypothetical protein [Microthrixaceae bacterium]
MAPDSEGPDTSDSAEVARLAAENERLRAELAKAAQQPSGGSGRFRSVAAWVMLVAGAVLMVVSVLGVWMRTIVLDTDRYVETVAPLADNSEIQDALSQRIATTITDSLDLEELATEVLPAKASILAAPIASGAEGLIQDAADKVVSSDQFETVWVDANRVAHDALVAAITGKDEGALSLSDGQVVIRLGPLVERALDLLDEQFGTDISSRVPTDSIDTEWVLVDSEQFASIQDSVRIMDTVAWVAAVLTLALLVGSVFVAHDRRLGVLRLGVAVALAMLVVVLSMSLGRDALVSNLPDTVRNPGAFVALFDIVTRFVVRAVRFAFVVGVVLAVGSWLVGPGSVPTRVRDAAANLIGRGSRAASEVSALGPVPGWVATNVRGLRVAVLIAGGLWLVIWNRPTGKAVLLVVLVVLVLLGVIQLLAGMAQQLDADSDATPTDGAGSTGPGTDDPGSGGSRSGEAATGTAT